MWMGDLESQFWKLAQSKMHTQKSLEKTLNFYLRLNLGSVQDWLSGEEVPWHRAKMQRLRQVVFIFFFLLHISFFLISTHLRTLLSKQYLNTSWETETMILYNKEYNLFKNIVWKITKQMDYYNHHQFFKKAK